MPLGCLIFQERKGLQLGLWQSYLIDLLNCQNSLRSQGMQVRYFLLNQHVQIF